METKSSIDRSIIERLGIFVPLHILLAFLTPICLTFKVVQATKLFKICFGTVTPILFMVESFVLIGSAIMTSIHGDNSYNSSNTQYKAENSFKKGICAVLCCLIYGLLRSFLNI